MWDIFVFNLYSYYRDLCCSGPALRLLNCHRHDWVCFIDTMKITVWVYFIATIVNWYTIILLFYHVLFLSDPWWSGEMLDGEIKIRIDCFVSHKYRICSFYFIFENNIFSADKAIRNLQLLITNNKYINHVYVIKPSNYWNKGLYQGSDDFCEGDCDSDLNFLASAISGNTLL